MIEQTTTYYELVISQFKKNKPAVFSVYIILLLFFIAIFADFIANDKPITCVYKDKRYFPILKQYSVSVGISKWDKDILNIISDWKNAEYQSVLWPLIPYSPNTTNIFEGYEPPGYKHLLGTDEIGRDVLSGMIHGTRIALAVGIISMAIAIIVGVFFGALAGYYGGFIDIIFQRIIEIMMTIPTFFLIITVLALYPGGGIWVIMVIIGMTSWPSVARFTRAEFLKVRNLDYVTAAEALGYSSFRTIFVHVLPNAIAPVLVIGAFGIASAILTESALSFLGFSSATMVSWGSILNESRNSTSAWWMAVFPGTAIFVTVTIYNLLGEGIRDALDPKLK
tara:strand:+ start:1165 stop:2175 length:1011 start_codon:yes stop_codon:yes gene_type:complete